MATIVHPLREEQPRRRRGNDDALGARGPVRSRRRVGRGEDLARSRRRSERRPREESESESGACGEPLGRGLLLLLLGRRFRRRLLHAHRRFPRASLFRVPRRGGRPPRARALGLLLVRGRVGNRVGVRTGGDVLPRRVRASGDAVRRRRGSAAVPDPRGRASLFERGRASVARSARPLPRPRADGIFGAARDPDREARGGGERRRRRWRVRGGVRVVRVRRDPRHRRGGSPRGSRGVPRVVLRRAGPRDAEMGAGSPRRGDQIGGGEGRRGRRRVRLRGGRRRRGRRRRFVRRRVERPSDAFGRVRVEFGGRRRRRRNRWVFVPLGRPGPTPGERERGGAGSGSGSPPPRGGFGKEARRLLTAARATKDRGVGFAAARRGGERRGHERSGDRTTRRGFDD